MRIAASLALALTLAVPAIAQDHDHGGGLLGGPAIAQNGTRGPVIRLKSGNETIEAEQYLGMGKQRISGPSVILIHEWWGLNDWVRDQARTYAAAGYNVIAMDLYRGQVANDPDTAHQLSRALPHDRALRDLKAAVAYLHAAPGAGKVGIIGWCMGGGLALELAIAEPNLQAVVVNYGTLPTDDAALKQITAPVLGNFGGLDKGIPPASVEAFDKQMKALGKRLDVKVYPDAGHAFENETNKAGYNAADAKDANRRTLLFLNGQLRL